MSKHQIHNFFLLAFSVCLISTTAALPAHAQQGLGERLGQQLDEGLERLSSEVREGWASLRKTVDRMGVQGRVYSRLRWDKHIATSQLEIEIQEEDVVVLRGEVADAAAKRKAVQLAGDTVGVARVVDELTVASPEPSPDR